MKSINRVGNLDKNYNKNDTSRVQLQKVLILDLTDISVQTSGMIFGNLLKPKTIYLSKQIYLLIDF
ncbi:hypothetical protein Hdeb2414_s0058g00759261 [Helianthus debilis subsp. tardiflorus]